MAVGSASIARRVAPGSVFGGGAKDGRESFVVEVAEPERQRILAAGDRQLVHGGLAGEGIGGRSEPAVRPDPERRVGRLVADPLVGDPVRRADGVGSGIRVRERPGVERSSRIDSSPHVDHGKRPEIAPGHLLFAGPTDHDRPARGTSKTRGFERGLARVLAAPSSAGVGDDHPDGLLAETKRLGEIRANPERALGARPDRQPAVVVPFGGGDAGLERDMGDVRRGVRGVQSMRGRLERGVDIARRVLHGTGPATGIDRVPPQVLGELGFGRLRMLRPARVDGCDRALRGRPVRRGDAHEVTIDDRDDSGHRGRGRHVDRIERGAECRRAEDRADQHVGPNHVDAIFPSSGDDLPRRGLRRRTADDALVLGRWTGGGRRASDIAGTRHDNLAKPTDERPEGDRFTVGPENEPVARLQLLRVGGPAIRREAEERRSGRGGRPSQVRSGIRHRATAERAHVVRADVRVAHDESDSR